MVIGDGLAACEMFRCDRCDKCTKRSSEECAKCVSIWCLKVDCNGCEHYTETWR